MKKFEAAFAPCRADSHPKKAPIRYAALDLQCNTNFLGVLAPEDIQWKPLRYPASPGELVACGAIGGESAAQAGKIKKVVARRPVRLAGARRAKNRGRDVRIHAVRTALQAQRSPGLPPASRKGRLVIFVHGFTRFCRGKLATLWALGSVHCLSLSQDAAEDPCFTMNSAILSPALNMN